MRSLVFKVFSTMTGRGKTWELCVWFLYFQSSYLLASPSLGSGAEEEDVAHCINKGSSACLPMPAHDGPAHATSHATACLSQNDGSVMLFAHQRLHGQNAVPLSETCSLKLARSYTARLLSSSRSNSLPSHCCGNHGATQLPSHVCARQVVLTQAAPSNACRGPLHRRDRRWLGRNS